MSDIPLTAPAADRNKDAILAVLADILPERGLVVEVASGTGQHVVHFAHALPGLAWQPSDPDWTMRESIRAWIAAAGLANLCDPLDIDARAEAWPIDRADAVLCINMIHIAPWAATAGLMAGAARLLRPHGRLVLYGPFRRPDRPTAPTNDAFDALLRSQNLDWGLRDLEAVATAAAARGLHLQRLVEMPANNLIVVFEAGPASLSARSDPSAAPALVVPTPPARSTEQPVQAAQAVPSPAEPTPTATEPLPPASSGPAPPIPPLDDALLQWLVRAPNLPSFTPPPGKAGAPAPDGATPPGLPMMITRGQRALLMEMGYSQETIRRMTPGEAHAILKAKPR